MEKVYDAFICDNLLTVTYGGHAILKDIKIILNLINTKKRVEFVPQSVESGEKIVVTFKREPEINDYIKEISEVVLKISTNGKTAVFHLDIKICKTHPSLDYMFETEKAIELNYKIADENARVVNLFEKSRCFMDVHFSKGVAKDENAVSVSADFGDKHMHILPLFNESGSCKIDKNGVYVNPMKHYVYNYSNDVMSLAMGDNPYDAISENFSELKKNGQISVALRKERIVPEIFRMFGWCTWDAFYHRVSSELIYQKLDEFKEKGIKVGWIIVDDGWAEDTKCDPEHPAQLLSFRENKEKFPEGLKEFIRRVKEEYGIKYVGMWQAFTGHWRGVFKDSEIVKNYPDAVTEIFDGRFVPAFDYEGAYKFWSMREKYLKEQGVDFVKVDNQGGMNYKFISKNVGMYEGLKAQHKALEQAIFENFDGAVINCMGGLLENCLSRPKTAVNRNSDDFFPKVEGSFAAHCMQNVYNATVHSMIHHCDFDMWWSKHKSAKQSAVLRAVSGGPVYVSDAVGNSNPEFITPICDENGVVYKLDDIAIPTLDCFYIDCRIEKTPLKIFNKKDDKFVLAAFALADGISEGYVSLSDFGGEGEYILEEYFSGEKHLLSCETPLTVSLSKDEVMLYNIYPVDENGVAHLGRKDKFIGISTECERTVKKDML